MNFIQDDITMLAIVHMEPCITTEGHRNHCVEYMRIQ